MLLLMSFMALHVLFLQFSKLHPHFSRNIIFLLLLVRDISKTQVLISRRIWKIWAGHQLEWNNYDLCVSKTKNFVELPAFFFSFFTIKFKKLPDILYSFQARPEIPLSLREAQERIFLRLFLLGTSNISTRCITCSVATHVTIDWKYT